MVRFRFYEASCTGMSWSRFDQLEGSIESNRSIEWSSQVPCCDERIEEKQYVRKTKLRELKDISMVGVFISHLLVGQNGMADWLGAVFVSTSSRIDRAIVFQFGRKSILSKFVVRRNIGVGDFLVSQPTDSSRRIGRRRRINNEKKQITQQQ